MPECDQAHHGHHLPRDPAAYSAVGWHPVSIVGTYLAHAGLGRRIEFTVGSFLLAPFLLQAPTSWRGAELDRAS